MLVTDPATVWLLDQAKECQRNHGTGPFPTIDVVLEFWTTAGLVHEAKRGEFHFTKAAAEIIALYANVDMSFLPDSMIERMTAV